MRRQNSKSSTDVTELHRLQIFNSISIIPLNSFLTNYKMAIQSLAYIQLALSLSLLFLIIFQTSREIIASESILSGSHRSFYVICSKTVCSILL